MILDACSRIKKTPQYFGLRGLWTCYTPGGIRTPGPRLRRPLLYPTELQAQEQLP